VASTVVLAAGMFLSLQPGLGASARAGLVCQGQYPQGGDISCLGLCDVGQCQKRSVVLTGAPPWETAEWCDCDGVVDLDADCCFIVRVSGTTSGGSPVVGAIAWGNCSAHVAGCPTGDTCRVRLRDVAGVLYHVAVCETEF
jgi:hypothetical protein